ncbi:hypothetical protein FQR65_LT20145 [Abscondita terminalis]|nr:hypothetical protein FQR65_LT20145 [Abscondita terminalis]
MLKRYEVISPVNPGAAAAVEEKTTNAWTTVMAERYREVVFFGLVVHDVARPHRVYRMAERWYQYQRKSVDKEHAQVRRLASMSNSACGMDVMEHPGKPARRNSLRQRPAVPMAMFSTPWTENENRICPRRRLHKYSQNRPPADRKAGSASAIIRGIILLPAPDSLSSNEIPDAAEGTLQSSFVSIGAERCFQVRMQKSAGDQRPGISRQEHSSSPAETDTRPEQGEGISEIRFPVCEIERQYHQNGPCGDNNSGSATHVLSLKAIEAPVPPPRIRMPETDVLPNPCGKHTLRPRASCQPAAATPAQKSAAPESKKEEALSAYSRWPKSFYVTTDKRFNRNCPSLFSLINKPSREEADYNHGQQSAAPVRGGQEYVAGGEIFHSDRGAQYTSREFADAPKLMDVRPLCGRDAEWCWDTRVEDRFSRR